MTWHTPSRLWQSGSWSLALRDDELADIAFDGRPVVRSIRAVVRDSDWDTAPLVVERVDASDATLTLHVRSRALGSSFRGVVQAQARGRGLVVLADLESERDFDTNRTGLVVLHLPATSGAALRVTHSSGVVEHTALPIAISPHQPVVDITGLAWSHAGLDVAMSFDGDVFEMEDQRNWTDASFKTYSRPLDLAFPYRVHAGEHVVQTVTIEVTTTDACTRPAVGDHLRLVRGGAFPEIAVAAATAPGAGPARTADAAAVLVELDLATANWRAALDRAASSGAPLDVRFVLTEAQTADELHAAVRALRPLPVARVTAFPPTGDARHVSDAATISVLRDALAEAGVTAAVVGGARSHFTELNREQHRLPDDLDGIVFSTTPLFHSRGTEQLIESVAIQRLVAAQAAQIALGRPVHIGPISLRPHFNDVATTSPPRPVHPDLREGYGPALIDAFDSRIDAPELAAWTIASAAALAVPGVATLSFFEEWGPRGIRRRDGTERPVAAAVRALRDLRDTALLHATSPDGLVWAIGGADAEGRERILVANLGGVRRTIRLTTPCGSAEVLLAPVSWMPVALPPAP